MGWVASAKGAVAVVVLSDDAAAAGFAPRVATSAWTVAAVVGEDVLRGGTVRVVELGRLVVEVVEELVVDVLMLIVVAVD